MNVTAKKQTDVHKLVSTLEDHFIANVGVVLLWMVMDFLAMVCKSNMITNYGL